MPYYWTLVSPQAAVQYRVCSFFHLAVIVEQINTAWNKINSHSNALPFLSSFLFKTSTHTYIMSSFQKHLAVGSTMLDKTKLCSRQKGNAYALNFSVTYLYFLKLQALCFQLSKDLQVGNEMWRVIMCYGSYNVTLICTAFLPCFA